MNETKEKKMVYIEPEKMDKEQIESVLSSSNDELKMVYAIIGAYTSIDDDEYLINLFKRCIKQFPHTKFAVLCGISYTIRGPNKLKYFRQFFSIARKLLEDKDIEVVRVAQETLRDLHHNYIIYKKKEQLQRKYTFKKKKK